MAELEHRSTVQAFLTRNRERRGFQEAHDALETKYQIASQLIAAQACVGRTQDAVAHRMAPTKSAVAPRPCQQAHAHHRSAPLLRRSDRLRTRGTTGTEARLAALWECPVFRGHLIAWL